MCKRFLPTLLALVCLITAGCNRSTVQPHQPLQEFEIINEHSLPHQHDNESHSWSYDDQQNWEIICGTMQSPIDIDTENLYPMENGGRLMLYYTQGAGYLEDMGYTIQAGLDGAAMINRRPFAPVQVHFHAHSEHAIDGIFFPIEAHFVHMAQDGRIAAIGVMFTQGEGNAAFGILLNAVASGDISAAAGIDFNQLLPADKSYYHYLGSYTTPPLTENVEWYILRQPVQVSSRQIEAFHQYYTDNYREIQSLNDRHVLVYAP